VWSALSVRSGALAAFANGVVTTAGALHTTTGARVAFGTTATGPEREAHITFVNHKQAAIGFRNNRRVTITFGNHKQASITIREA